MIRANIPTDKEILNEMSLYNSDEVGIYNPITYKEAEYNLLLSDKYIYDKKVTKEQIVKSFILPNETKENIRMYYNNDLEYNIEYIKELAGINNLTLVN